MNEQRNLDPLPKDEDSLQSLNDVNT